MRTSWSQAPWLALALWVGVGAAASGHPAEAMTGPAPSPPPGAPSEALADPVASLPELGPWRVELRTGEAELSLPWQAGQPHEALSTAQSWRLVLHGVRLPAEAPELPVGHVLGRWRAWQEGESVVIEAPWRFACPTEVRQQGDRLVARLRTIWREEELEALGPGLRLRRQRWADGSQVQAAYAVEIHPQAPVVVTPALASLTRLGARVPTSVYGQKLGALVAINGAYFNPQGGEPLGLLVVDGQVVTGPLYGRSALAFGAHRPISIAATRLSLRVHSADGEGYDLDGVNQDRQLGKMVLFTGSYGASTRTSVPGVELQLLPDNTVLSVGELDSPLPAGARVLSGQGPAAEWLRGHVKVGDRLAFSNPLDRVFPGMRHILGAGPTLLRGGQVAITAEAERFRPDVALGRAPRTAVGLVPGGGTLLMVADGRQPRRAAGLTLAELAERLRALGATEAINLDGGGSSAMAIRGQLVNQPSDGAERPVPNAVVVMPQGAMRPAWLEPGPVGWAALPEAGQGLPPRRAGLAWAGQEGPEPGAGE